MRHFRILTIYAFTIFFNAAISFATFSLLTHHLNEVDYGIINLYNSFLVFLSPFIGVGVQFALSVDYFKMDEGRYRKHFTNAFIIPLSACVLFIFISLIFHRTIERLTG